MFSKSKTVFSSDPNRAHRRREWKALIWGAFSVLGGLIALLGSLYLDELHHPTTYRIFLELLSHVGIALLLLGIVGIVLEFKNWRVYFEERLANIIQKKEFLRTLEPDQLRILLKDVFRAIYKVDEFDRNSFHDFLASKIQNYVGDPYRENTRSVMTVDPPDADGSFTVLEDLRYTCRKVSAEKPLQPEIQLKFDKTDLATRPEQYTITLCLPDKPPKGFCIPEDFKPFWNEKKHEIVFDSIKEDDKKEKLKEKLLVSDDEQYGFTLSLEPFGSLEWLGVHQRVKYALKEERFLAWSSSYLSLGFEVIINYPAKVFTVQLEHFGMDEKNVTIVDHPGVYSLKYDSWLLPKSGVAYRCITDPIVRRALKLEEDLKPIQPPPASTAHHSALV